MCTLCPKLLKTGTPGSNQRRLILTQKRYPYIALGGAVALAWISSCHAWVSTGSRPSGEHLRAVERSPQYDAEQGTFVNALGSVQPMFGEVIGKYWDNEALTEPAAPLPRDEGLVARLKTPAPEALRVSWIGHSTMLVEVEGKRFLTDPIFSRRASPFEYLGPKRFEAPALKLGDLPDLDAVLISHDHYDHLDMATVTALASEGVPFYMPLGVGAHFRYWGIAEEQIHELDWWEERDVGGITLACVPSRHFSGRAGLDRDKTLWSGWAIVGDARRAFFSGDTSMTPDFLKIGERYGPFDIAMVESGAYNAAWVDAHLGPEQAVDVSLMVRGRSMVPIHWGTFSLALHAWTEPAERLLAEARKKGVHLVIPIIGGSVSPSTPATDRPWWPEVDVRSADEDPIVSNNLPDYVLPQPLSPAH